MAVPDSMKDVSKQITKALMKGYEEGNMKTTQEYLSNSSIDNEPREMFDDEEMGEVNLETGMEYQIEVVCKVRPMLDGQKAYVVPMISGPLPKERVLEAIEISAKSERFKVVMQSILGEQL